MYLNAPWGSTEMSNDNQTSLRHSTVFFFFFSGNDFQNKASVWRSISDDFLTGHYSWTSSKQKIIIIIIIWSSGQRVSKSFLIQSSCKTWSNVSVGVAFKYSISSLVALLENLALYSHAALASWSPTSSVLGAWLVSYCGFWQKTAAGAWHETEAHPSISSVCYFITHCLCLLLLMSLSLKRP